MSEGILIPCVFPISEKMYPRGKRIKIKFVAKRIIEPLYPRCDEYVSFPSVSLFSNLIFLTISNKADKRKIIVMWAIIIGLK